MNWTRGRRLHEVDIGEHNTQCVVNSCSPIDKLPDLFSKILIELLVVLYWNYEIIHISVEKFWLSISCRYKYRFKKCCEILTKRFLIWTFWSYKKMITNLLCNPNLFVRSQLYTNAVQVMAGWEDGRLEESHEICTDVNEFSTQGMLNWGGWVSTFKITRLEIENNERWVSRNSGDKGGNLATIRENTDHIRNEKLRLQLFSFIFCCSCWAGVILSVDTRVRLNISLPCYLSVFKWRFFWKSSKSLCYASVSDIFQWEVSPHPFLVSFSITAELW